MAYLQSKHNLGDLENVNEARDNLGLGSMAFQLHTSANIEGGRAYVDTFRLKPNGYAIDSNYVLMSSSVYGDAIWQPLVLASWLNTPQEHVSLASMCNDANFVTASELERVVDSLAEPTINALIGNELFVPTIVSSNCKTNVLEANKAIFSQLETSSFRFGDISINNNPCVLTNGEGGNNIQLVELEHSFSNSATHKVGSARAVSNLFSYVQDVTKNIPDNTGAFMISTNNLSDFGFDPVKAVSNLGLNNNFQTSHLTIKDVVLQKPSYDTQTEFEVSSAKQYRLMKEAGTNRLKFKEDKLINNYTERSYDFPASAYNVNTLYEYMSNKLQGQMLVENVLSEIVENNNDGSENPYKAVFRQRLRDTGLQEICFTGDWNSLVNAPKTLSAFDNMNGNNETLFLYSKSNFLDIPDKQTALNNLGVAKVALTGSFDDLNLPSVFQTIVNSNDILYDTAGGKLPFLTTYNFLNEFSGSSALVRENLGIGELATFDRKNVSILDGDISVSECAVTSNFTYGKSNTSLELTSITNDIFLRCETSDGSAVWDRLPIASQVTSGTVTLIDDINDINETSSNSVMSAFGMSNFANQLRSEREAFLTPNYLVLGENKWRLNFDSTQLVIEKYDEGINDYVSVHTFS